MNITVERKRGWYLILCQTFLSKSDKKQKFCIPNSISYSINKRVWKCGEIMLVSNYGVKVTIAAIEC